MTTAANSQGGASAVPHPIKNSIFYKEPILEVVGFMTAALLAACPLAALYTGEDFKTAIHGFLMILASPCPLVTDYYRLGGLTAAFLNAGLCASGVFLIMLVLRTNCETTEWAGFFLVIAHCFYGLNFFNMWPPILGILIYCRTMKIRFRDNMGVAMFSTAFGPFFSELLYRYSFRRGMEVELGLFRVNLLGILLMLLLATFLGFAIPAMLPGALMLHRGFNLYNGGLAFGLLGLLIYSFMYKTWGHSTVTTRYPNNEAYAAHGDSYILFCSVFFIVVFLLAILIGWYLNGHSFNGYRELTKSTGHRVDFIQRYGMGKVWINLGIYGLMMLAYLDGVILFTEGAGFTGATCGVLLAAMTFSASGQHPRNVYPILGGYVLLSLFVTAVSVAAGHEVPWTLSTQGYMNGAAFATGLCPFTGRFNRRIGVLAGFLCAVMCTATSLMHGGFVLYNGGLTAGITALILTPMLDHYYPQGSRAK